MRLPLWLMLLAMACAPDADGDGVNANDDCDDADSTVYPGAPELCDGYDSDCDGDDEADADGDGYRSCADCDDTRAEIFPGAPSACDGSDADCDGEISDAESSALGEDPACAAESCSQLAAERADAGPGAFWVDGGTSVAAFQVDCDGQGWTELSLYGDGVLVGSTSPSNPWHKCADDATAPWPWLPEEASVTEDYAGGRFDEYRPWVRPSDGYRYTRDEVEALAGGMSELQSDVSLVASSNDDDNARWQEGGFGGLEVYAIGADGTWFLLTPGTGGECGGASGWPTADTLGMQYHWSASAGQSWWQGTQSAEDDPDLAIGALPPNLAMPVGFVLATFTGGGVAVGYDQRVIRVR